MPLPERSMRAWCLEMSGSSRTRALSGARPIVPEEVMRKDLSVCREAGKASEFAELDDGDP
ncbi:cytidine deaminase domain protein [Actinomyces sp. oral taxon 170 str. F0386]|nr:cytidine deaminase domain protein [Actinomyces sp. oral taxon 170 str. F0386]